MAAYGYARVSDESQARSGLGLAAQQNQIRAHCRAHGWRLAGLYVDRAVSGTRPFRLRPRGGELAERLVGGDHVIVAKLDRAWRNVRDCAETIEAWRAAGIHAHLLDLGVSTNTPTGELVIGVMAAIAQWESRRIGERIRDAKGVLRTQGRLSNASVWIGWRVGPGGRLVPHAGERALAQRIVHARRRGQLYREIVRRLTKERRRWRGRPWTIQACARLYLRAKAQWRVPPPRTLSSRA